MYKKSLEMRHFLVFHYPEEPKLARSWAAGVARDGKAEQTAPMVAVGCVINAAQDAKTEILAELKSGLLKEECSMTLRLAQIVIASLACAAASLVMAQTPAPRPDPALKKLSALVGHWTYEGEYKAGPLGPGGKVTGEYNAQMTLGGFFFQAQWTEKGPAGQTRGLDIEAYDPVNKNFVSNWYLSDGSRFSGVCAVSEKTYAIAGKFLLTGKQYEFKDTLILAADLMSVTERGEISADGKTWTPLVENKWTKVRPAPKK